MALAETVAGCVEHVFVTSAQGHAFVMELSRLNTLEGKVGGREARSEERRVGKECRL